MKTAAMNLDFEKARVLLTGAGSSAYAASAVASAWPRAVAIPTTDLLIDPERYLGDTQVVNAVPLRLVEI